MSRSDVRGSLPEQKQKLLDGVLSALLPIDGLHSVTLVGSFIDQDDLAAISDVDVVVVFERLSPSRFDAAVAAVGALTGAGLGQPARRVVVNATLGPLKQDQPTDLVIHLMLYDLDSHRAHVLKSPFTCLDWERSHVGWGPSLAEIYPVGPLCPRDFAGARRSLVDYVHDLESGVVSFRRLEPSGERMVEVPDRQPLDRRSAGEYAYHIIRHLIVNALKMRTGRNCAWDHAALIADWRREFPDLASWVPFFERIRQVKLARGAAFPDETVTATREFLDAFSGSIDRQVGGALKLRLVRHARTVLNDGSFLGVRRDPRLEAPETIAALEERWDFVHSSPLLRALETAQCLAPDAEIAVHDQLAEIDYGEAEGQTPDQFTDRFPEIARHWNDGKDDLPFPGGEGTLDVRRRVRAYLDSLAAVTGRGLAVTHNVVLRVLAADLLGLDARKAHRLPVDHLQALEICRIDGRWMPDWDRAITARLLDAYLAWPARDS
jgi:broad specificity phosphatase PhoE